jgi:hypothetical protein
MQDLTQQYEPVANLVPTSQSEGGEVHDNALAMTAPGSQPISVPAPGDPGQPHSHLPMPIDSNPAGSIPVSNAPNKPRVLAGREGAGQWTTIFEHPASAWKETP